MLQERSGLPWQGGWHAHPVSEPQTTATEAWLFFNLSVFFPAYSCSIFVPSLSWQTSLFVVLKACTKGSFFPCSDVLFENVEVRNGHGLTLGSEASGGMLNITYRSIFLNGKGGPQAPGLRKRPGALQKEVRFWGPSF